MAKKLPEVDVVVIGMGWTGGILSKELAEAGLKVVALERGEHRAPAEDFSVPHIRDELNYSMRHGLMMDTRRDTLTIRNNVKETALPMRRLGSFLSGDGLGGAGSHWNGHTWRWTDHEFKVRSMYEQKYGKKFIPPDMTVQDWGITYAELEPFYDRFEYVAGISGTAGNVDGKHIAGGNPFEAERKRGYPLPALDRSYACELFEGATKKAGYHPFPMPTSNASKPYTNPDGSEFGQCQYCGFCERYGCESNAKGSPLITVIPLAKKQPTFELRTQAWVTRIVMDKQKKTATGVEYTNLTNGEQLFQPAKLVILAAYALNNVHLMLLSGIGKPYDPATGKGVVGRNYCYQTGAGATLFFDEGHIFNPFMSTGGLSTVIDDFNANWDFDRAEAGARFVGGYTVSGGMYHGRPIEYHPVPGGTPRWGKAWKEAVQKWYLRAMSIGSSGSVMANRYNFLDLDPTYRNAFGQPLMRMTFDYKENEQRISAHAAKIINEISKSMNPTHLNEAKARMSWSVVPYQSTHNTGGTIMGTDPSMSVTNKYGQCWDAHNLFICGASLFGHNAAYNPTGPVGALAYFTADAIKNTYLKHPGALLHA
ncbi:GMC family oxidoreductase [Bordetella holmesii]|uniref:GMC oxidoreductase family protein n=2 Tax=Bordetella holmesii TaxID=35814 RepID=A0ABN0RVV3_9BORD|nr:GMC family oxidoreductase [Bordetella holmesii]AHV94561.1 GMC oxidoreductase family protein [Bordetella holmesii ATCC 51541]AIT27346.1 GMC oxidoreductase family protein [Bordetella holmesii 44057]EWM44210.1 GMC oxidoreductase family protein [Bordetella holmesii 41130]EWM47934.1 GMC oxidoreductase family protein [Bordetella holmesii 35009]EWM52094.1 GMC oxidoreductase family protein [Bordetella holmesii 70147]